MLPIGDIGGLTELGALLGIGEWCSQYKIRGLIMSDNLEELHRIHTRLNGLVSMNSGDCIEYDVPGTAIGFKLLHEADRIAVQRRLMTVGTDFPDHHHEVDEWAFLYRGRMTLRYCGVEEEVVAPAFKHFAANHQHGGVVLEEAWVVFVTMPPAKGYPDGKSDGE